MNSVYTLRPTNYPFNAQIWNILISLMPNRQKQFIATRMQHIHAFVGLNV